MRAVSCTEHGAHPLSASINSASWSIRHETRYAHSRHLALLMAGLTQTAPIVIGSMSRDVVSNSLHYRQPEQLEWPGQDVTKGLTYARPWPPPKPAACLPGFDCARNNDAQLFVDALMIGTGNPYTGQCDLLQQGTWNRWHQGDLLGNLI